MYVVVQAQDGEEANGYGSVGGARRLEQLRSSRSSPRTSGRIAAILGASVCVCALLALSMSGDGTVEEESTFTGSIMKYNPTTGLLKTKFADPGLFTRVWWGQDVSWSDLKTSWWSAKDALGDPKIQTYIPNLNFPKASTLALLGQPFPKPSTSDFDSLVVLWKGRFEIVNEGLYNITLNASTAGALLNISGETVIINDDGGAETLTSFKLSAGFHPIQVLWKAPPVDAEYPKAYISESTCYSLHSA